jgi:hypothetical protein
MADGTVATIALLPAGSPAANPAFDVTRTRNRSRSGKPRKGW